MKPGRIAALAGRGPRIAARLAGTGLALSGAAIALLAARRDARAVLHRLCRGLAHLLGLRIKVVGEIPRQGLIVCNHLGYLDIVVLAATAPVVFVAKDEVNSWPIAGWFARRTYTLFVRRGRTSGTAWSVRQMQDGLAAGRPIVLFPEGTSSGGASVLPFKSSLLGSAADSAVTPAALAYALDEGDGDPAETVCYWKDHTLLPHLFRLFGRRRIRATLVFGPPDGPVADRKRRALRLRAQVLALKSEAEAELV